MKLIDFIKASGEVYFEDAKGNRYWCDGKSRIGGVFRVRK